MTETALNRNIREYHEAAWYREIHGEWSQGVNFFLRAWADMVPQYGDTLCDWGSGHGRALRKFRDRGLRVEGIDIAENANKYFDGVVHVAPIWNPSIGDKQYVLGYCTDVMQFVPPQLVLPTLRVIKKHTVDECWFNIPYFTSPFEPTRQGLNYSDLVQTNRPASWWVAQFSEVFPRFRFSHEEDNFIIQAFSERL